MSCEVITEETKIVLLKNIIHNGPPMNVARVPIALWNFFYSPYFESQYIRINKRTLALTQIWLSTFRYRQRSVFVWKISQRL